METPGASRFSIGARFVKLATASGTLVLAPTLTALEIQAGELSALVKPSLPLATTVAMPAERSTSIAGLSGSSSHGPEELPPPRLMFAAAMAKLERMLKT